MERRTLGRTGMHVSILGFGGAEIGYGHAAQATVDRLLGEALDAGLNVIDTAECYLDSEALIGRAVAHRRREYYLLTKCGYAAGLGLPDWDARLLMPSIERSLHHLRTDHLDVVQLHSCAADVLRRGEVIEALQRARDAGKTRYLGYSGDGEAARYAITCGAFDTLQTSLNIADQEAIEWPMPLGRARGMGVIAKRPLANVAWRHGTRPADPYIQAYWERLGLLDYGFLQQPLGEAVGMALRFTLSVEGVHTAILGSLIGGIVGTALPVSLVGTLLGACLGAFAGSLIGDLWAGRPLFPSFEAGWGAAVGRFWGTISKLTIGAIIVVVLALAAFF